MQHLLSNPLFQGAVAFVGAVIVTMSGAQASIAQNFNAAAKAPTPSPAPTTITTPSPPKPFSISMETLVAAIGENKPVDERLVPLLFEGGSDSLIAKMIGLVEGTRAPDGSKTEAWYGHGDIGNGSIDLGTFAAQNCPSPDACDTIELAKLQAVANHILAMGQKLGVTITWQKMINGLDLANQAPAAVYDKGGYVEQLKHVETLNDNGIFTNEQGKRITLNDNQIILQARVQSYSVTPIGTTIEEQKYSFFNPNFQAPGLNQSGFDRPPIEPSPIPPSLFGANETYSNRIYNNQQDRQIKLERMRTILTPTQPVIVQNTTPQSTAVLPQATLPTKGAATATQSMLLSPNKITPPSPTNQKTILPQPHLIEQVETNQFSANDIDLEPRLTTNKNPRPVFNNTRKISPSPF
ncbi:MAG: hypothetical protein ACOYK8_00060 [Alphaproteobacteria bacterium]